MTSRFLGLLAMTASFAASTWTGPRTADGQPDLQGIWTNATITPMERPADLAGKQFFSEQEVAAYEKKVLENTNKDRRDGGAEADVGRAYNDAWWDIGTKIVSTRRTSIVIDPPDGKIPPLTPAAKDREATRTAARQRPPEGPEDRGLPERCILWPTAGPPMLPSAYNNNYQILQTPGQVTILIEMIHDVRVIPLDGRPHVSPNIRLWLGDPRGHWEGGTLVVGLDQFHRQESVPRIGPEPAPDGALHARRSGHDSVPVHGRRSDGVYQALDGRSSHAQDAGADLRVRLS